MDNEIGVRRVLKAFDEAHPEGVPAKPPTMSQLNVALGGKPIGRPPSDDPKVSIGVRLPASMLAELDAARGERARPSNLACLEGNFAWRPARGGLSTG